MRVYQIPVHGSYIDLDHVLEIGEPYVDDRMGHGGWFVGHWVRMAFRDDVSRYESELRPSNQWFHGGLDYQDKRALEEIEWNEGIRKYRDEVWKPMFEAWSRGRIA